MIILMHLLQIRERRVQKSEKGSNNSDKKCCAYLPAHGLVQLADKYSNVEIKPHRRFIILVPQL